MASPPRKPPNHPQPPTAKRDSANRGVPYIEASWTFSNMPYKRGRTFSICIPRYQFVKFKSRSHPPPSPTALLLLLLLLIIRVTAGRVDITPALPQQSCLHLSLCASAPPAFAEQPGGCESRSLPAGSCQRRSGRSVQRGGRQHTCQVQRSSLGR